ncbi:MAG: hypothetical protein U9Q62_06585 [Campylobacterota bacterium]|nr:hypothetical protein [Campylobacterota bacterium]
MRNLLLAMLLITTAVHADRIKMKAMGCPSMMAFTKVPSEILQDDIKLSLYAVKNGCRILTSRDQVTAIGYDPRNDKTQFMQIIHKESGETLYIRRKNVQVEQPGKKNQIRF